MVKITDMTLNLCIYPSQVSFCLQHMTKSAPRALNFKKITRLTVSNKFLCLVPTAYTIYIQIYDMRMCLLGHLNMHVRA